MSLKEERKGNIARLRQALPDYRPNLLRIALRLTRNYEEAEDLVQETLLRAYERAETFRAATENASLLPWLSAIMKNCFINLYRKKRFEVQNRLPWCEETEYLRWEAHNMPPALTWNAPEHIFAEKEHMAAVYAAVHLLSDSQRELLRLAAEGNLSYEEISSQLHLPIGTVRSRLYRARLRIARATAAWLPVAESAWLPTIARTTSEAK
jgi:RNA polymerase sigma-70 factor, ECF subfamily